MASITTRAGKGSPLTNAELDANFTNLNNEKANQADLSAVALSGAYSDLTGKPTIDSLAPSQSGNSGKYLTTNGTAVSWGTVDALPSQTGNTGKYLTTDGTSPSWQTVQFASDLDDLTDVVISSPAANQYLKYNGTNWVNSGPAAATRTRTDFVATAGQTTFFTVYDPAYVDVYLNGALLNDSDYTATNGTSIVLAAAATVGDIIEVVAYGTFDIATPQKFLPVTTYSGSTVQIPTSNGFFPILKNNGVTANILTY